ncbi:MAG: MlaD family protein [Verrucomicrobiota bacterium]|nr:MlaD family protein [Verrucomicrobiota bacterium]
MNPDRSLALKVGIFVAIGLAMIAGYVFEFGRLGEGVKSYYNLTVQFENAAGLLKGADVLFSGAKIGRVAGAPRLAKNEDGVLIPLRIYDYIKIPVGSKFAIGSTGLLGDRYVTVSMPSGVPKEFIPKNSLVSGTRDTGIDDLTKDGSLLIADLRKTVQNINGTFDRLNKEALSPETLKNLRGSIEHLNESMTSLSQTTTKLDGVADKADATMVSAKKDADDLQETLGEGRKTLATATQLLRDAKSGNGVLASMINDPDLARDLRALVANLRAHGILFYRDSAARNEPPSEPTKRRSR